MSLWADYKQERDNCHVLEKDHGFATYYFIGEKECYLEDFYVKPKVRGTGLGLEIAKEVEQVAKEAGCEIFTGSVRVGAPYDTESMRLMIAYGFKLATVSGNMIYMAKEI